MSFDDLSRAKDCPFCGKNDFRILTGVEIFDSDLVPPKEYYNFEQKIYLFCDAERSGCGASTDDCESIEEAITSWNERFKYKEKLTGRIVLGERDI